MSTQIVEHGVKIPPSTLRTRLREAREWRNLEQADVARELGVGRSTISNYERGTTPPSKLVINAWAVVCDVDVEWLKTGVASSPVEPGGIEPPTSCLVDGRFRVTSLADARRRKTDPQDRRAA